MTTNTAHTETATARDAICEAADANGWTLAKNGGDYALYVRGDVHLAIHFNTRGNVVAAGHAVMEDGTWAAGFRGDRDMVCYADKGKRKTVLAWLTALPAEAATVAAITPAQPTTREALNAALGIEVAGLLRDDVLCVETTDDDRACLGWFDTRSGELLTCLPGRLTETGDALDVVVPAAIVGVYVERMLAAVQAPGESVAPAARRALALELLGETCRTCSTPMPASARGGDGLCGLCG